MFPIYIAMIENSEDKSLAEHLYNTYKNKMYSIARSVLLNPFDAEDAVSAAFTRIITNINKFHGIDCNKTKVLIGIIVRGVAIDIYRKNEKIEFEEFDDTTANNHHPDNPIDYAVNNESYEKLLAALKSLGEEYSNVVLLKVQYGYADKEIASLLNITEGNVRVRYSRARKMMKEKLAKGSANDEYAGIQRNSF